MFWKVIVIMSVIVVVGVGCDQTTLINNQQEQIEKLSAKVEDLSNKVATSTSSTTTTLLDTSIVTPIIETPKKVQKQAVKVIPIVIQPAQQPIKETIQPIVEISTQPVLVQPPVQQDSQLLIEKCRIQAQQDHDNALAKGLEFIFNEFQPKIGSLEIQIKNQADQIDSCYDSRPPLIALNECISYEQTYRISVEQKDKLTNDMLFIIEQTKDLVKKTIQEKSYAACINNI